MNVNLYFVTFVFAFAFLFLFCFVFLVPYCMTSRLQAPFGRSPREGLSGGPARTSFRPYVILCHDFSSSVSTGEAFLLFCASLFGTLSAR